MAPTEQRTFHARMAMLAETAAFVEDFCARGAVGRDDALRLTLIVEELFTNTVTHGHGGDCDALVVVALTRSGGHVELRYEDAAPAYDPLTRLVTAPPSLTAPVEARPVGGLGMHLVGQLASGARYAYESGRNRLWLVVALDGRPDPPGAPR
jgi:anti-sigma regulatory factor (Ser/Thr protein kinase)